MTGAVKAVRFGAFVVGVALLASSALAQKAPAAGPDRNQVRLRILDACVMSQSGKLAEEGAGPKCNCYAAKITKAMTDEEVATYRKGVPQRLADESTKLLITCK
jgi:hypothetical protein